MKGSMYYKQECATSKAFRHNCSLQYTINGLRKHNTLQYNAVKISKLNSTPLQAKNIILLPPKFVNTSSIAGYFLHSDHNNV